MTDQATTRTTETGEYADVNGVHLYYELHGAGRPLLLGGCYLAGTGGQPPLEQAFAAGVFRLLLEHQNFVSWTDAGFAEEARYRRLTVMSYVGAAVALIAVVTFGWFVWRR